MTTEEVMFFEFLDADGSLSHNGEYTSAAAAMADAHGRRVVLTGFEPSAPPAPSDAPAPDYEAIARAAGWGVGETQHGEPCFIAVADPDKGLISAAPAGDWKNLCERERLVPLPAAPADPVKAEMLAALKAILEGGCWHDDGTFVYELPGERDDNGELIEDTDDEGAIGLARAAVARAEGRA